MAVPLTTDQVKKMMAFVNENQTMTLTQCEKMALKLTLSPKSVAQWFGIFARKRDEKANTPEALKEEIRKLELALEKSESDFKAQKEVLGQEVLDLKAQNEKVTNANQALKAEKEDAEVRFGWAKKCCFDWKATARGLEAQKKTDQAEMDSLKKAQEDLETQIKDLKEANNKLEDKLSSRIEACFFLEDHIKRLEQAQDEADKAQSDTDQEDLKARIEVLERDNLELQSKNQERRRKLKTQSRKHKEEISDFKIRYDSLDLAYSNLEVQHQAEMESLQKEVESERARKRSKTELQLDQYFKQDIDLRNNVKAEMQDYKAQVEALKDALKTQAQVIPQYLKAQKKLKAQKQNLEKTQEYEAQIEALKTENVDCKNQIDRLRARIEAQKAQKEPEPAHVDLVQNDEEKEELKQELKELRETWRVSGVFMNTLMLEAIEMRKTEASLRDELAQLKSTEWEKDEEDIYN